MPYFGIRYDIKEDYPGRHINDAPPVSPSKMDAKAHQLLTFAILFLGYAFYALNRKAVSLVLPELVGSVLNKSDAGVIISAQNIAYAISKFIGGILSDRLSSRVLFGSGLFLSGLATILFGWYTESVTVFAILWFCNGFAQGFGWPSCAKVLRHWFSPQQFGTFWSLLSASANISGGVSPFLATLITVTFNWQTTLYVFGTISLLMSFVAFGFLVNRPEDIGLPPINPNVAPAKEKGHHSSSSWVDLFKSPFIWLISFSYMVVYAAKTSAVDWGQLYLLEEKRKPQLVASSFTSSVETGGFFGGILAGYLTDLIMKRSMASGKPASNDRLPVATMMLFMVSLSLHALCFFVDSETSPIFVSGVGFILGMALYGPIAIFGVVASESAPAHLSGTSHAIVALAANVGAIMSGLPFSLVAQRYSWNTVFLMLEVITIFTTITLAVFGSRIKPNLEVTGDKKHK